MYVHSHKLRRTLSYWISIMYLEGSLLFIIGATFSMLPLIVDPLKQQKELALVAVPYFAGGIAFLLGSYAGVLEVLKATSAETHI